MGAPPVTVTLYQNGIHVAESDPAFFTDPALVADDAIDMRGSNEWPEAVAEFLVAGERKRDAEKAYQAARNRVEALMAGHKRGWGGGYAVSVSVTPANPGRPAKPGEMIGARAETRRLNAKVMEEVS